jgi:4-amino-4-deoxy-L-arabinose transferase-like glycosyltransferase
VAQETLRVSRATFAAGIVAILFAGLILRVLWLRADPPLVGGPGGVGIVWHDEGAWVHNARNRVLWGAWRTDQWNPIFITPVFTALEYGAFRVAGVGTWQARVVPVLSGVICVAALMAGLTVVAGRRAALIGGVLLATNYPLVMWNRAALMESTMTALLACAWAAYAQGQRGRLWPAAAGVMVTLAWFTKAAAAFFVGALVLEAALAALAPRRLSQVGNSDRDRRVATGAMLGLLISATFFAAVFVIPYWPEYSFYNWQMSVTRKPEYSWRAFADRASWLPFVQGIFSQMPIVLIFGAAGLLGILSRLRGAVPGERLLAWWVLLGFAELVVHDSGNERRYVMFVPALVGLASIYLTSNSPATGANAPRVPRWLRIVSVPVLLGIGYIVVGTLMRPFFIDQVRAGDLQVVVRLSAIVAGLIVVSVLVWWETVSRALASLVVPTKLVIAAVAVSVGWSALAYFNWAKRRTETNYGASISVGRVLSAGTLVQGKLANGLSLENRIRPLFIGNHFGNFEDRLRRDDVLYVLTYDLPRLGYESSDGSGLIPEILDQYPQRRVVATFVVDETPEPDRAVLIEKRPK